MVQLCFDFSILDSIFGNNPNPNSDQSWLGQNENNLLFWNPKLKQRKSSSKFARHMKEKIMNIFFCFDSASQETGNSFYEMD